MRFLSMITKDQVKREIDNLPEDKMDEIYNFLHYIRTRRAIKKKVPSFRLKGKFDDIDIRSQAYE